MSIYKECRDAGFRNKWGHKMIYATCSVCGETILTRWDWIKDIRKCNNIHELTGTKRLYIKDKRINDTLNGMISRCYSLGKRDYKWYGAKGVKICDEWLNSATAFYDWYISQSGGRNDLSIDRINADGDYCPENCHLISREENSRWKSTTNAYTVNGLTKTGRQWADYLGIGTNRINKYVREYGEVKAIEFIRGMLAESKSA